MLALIPAADLHLLAGQVIAAQVDLQPRVAGIGAVGEAVHHLLQRVHRLIGAPLVALDIGDLFIIAERSQIVRVGHVAMRGMQLDEAVQRADRIGVVVLQVLRVALHELGIHRPARIRIVLLHQVELVGGGLVTAGVQRIDAIVVQVLDRSGWRVVLRLLRPWSCRSRRAAAATTRPLPAQNDATYGGTSGELVPSPRLYHAGPCREAASGHP